MKAFVTGGAGFIGSHLVEELIHNGMQVHVLDTVMSESLQHLLPQIVIHHEDIRSEQAKQIIIQEKPDLIFHLAAQADVEKSLNSPKYDADVNVIGTINILEASRQAAVKKVIFASTSGVYGDLQKEFISEEDLTIPISYYGLSKLTAESYIRLFGQLYGIRYTILRYGNVYGPRQIAKGEGGVIAVFLDRIKNQKPITIYGNGRQTRDFVYVKDVVQANIAAINRGDKKTVQIGTAQPTSINQLVHLLTNIHGSSIQTVFKPARKGDIMHSCLDNQKAREWLCWQPKVTLVQGLQETYHAFFERRSS